MKFRPAIGRFAPLALGAAAVALAADAGGQNGGEPEEIEFSEARLFFELNDTDGDLGIHGFWDGRPWKRIEMEGPHEREMLNIWVRGKLRQQGLTEMFFESAEPDFDELSPERFFRRFPEGTYEIEGATLDGRELEAEIELSHTLAAPPGNVMVNGVPAAENCDAELPVVSEPVTISWDAVTQSHPELGNTGVPVVVDLYQLVGEFEADGREMVLQVDLPPGVTSFEFPEDFTGLAGDELKFEIIVRLDNNNQTAFESCVEID
ncbi:MAG: hypothetical protein ACT4UP_10435 [Gammaproteobacteria bacterium]